MDLNLYAKRRWEAGDRDEDSVADQYIRNALASSDPAAYLMPAIRAQVSEAFRVYRNSIEDEVFPLEDPQDSPQSDKETTDATASRPHGYSPGQTRHQKMQLLLRTEVWTSTRGFIAWADLTVQDAVETIVSYRNQITGVERRIAKLDQAKRLIEKYQVDTLGEVPWREATEVTVEDEVQV